MGDLVEHILTDRWAGGQEAKEEGDTGLEQKTHGRNVERPWSLKHTP
jgi:hypothetical protein